MMYLDASELNETGGKGALFPTQREDELNLLELEELENNLHDVAIR